MSPELHFQELVSILRRRRRSILAITIVGTSLVLLGTMLIPPQYTATAQIVVDIGGIYPGDGTPPAAPPDEAAIIQTHITALTSRAQLARVLASLSEDPEFRAAGLQAPIGIRQAVASLWHEFGAPLRERLALLAASAGLGQDRAPSLAEVEALRLDRFRRRLSVFQETDSHVIAVDFKSTSAGQAALAANRVAQLYVEHEEARKQAQISRVVRWLAERIPVVEAQFQQAEIAVQDYRVAHGLADANRVNLPDQKLADLTRQLILAEAELARRQAELAAFSGPRRPGAGLGTLVATAEAPVDAELRQQEDALLQAKAKAEVTLGENHPEVQQLEAQLQVVRRKLADQAGRALGGLTGEVRIAGEQVAAIRKELSELEAAGSQAQKAEPRLNELEREASAAGQIYENLLQRREQLRAQQEMMEPALRILSLAAPPDQPSSSSRLLFILPALIAFSIGGSLLAVAAERLQKGMRSAQDINDALGIPCVGFVPLIRGRGNARPHQYLLENPFAAYTESIRSVVAALQRGAPGRPPKVILISSSVPNEGKTTLAVSLAVYFALIGRRALLVDLDFRHPAVARELGGHARIGGLDAVLPDAQSWRAAVRQVQGLPLDYLPVPGNPGDPLLPFVGGSVPRLLSQLRNNYDCVVIDSPPLLAVAEARLLVAMADKVLLAVQWRRTQRVVAQDALDLLRDHGHLGEHRSELVGAVLTQVDLKKHAQYRYGGLESLHSTHGPTPQWLTRRWPKLDEPTTSAEAGDALSFAARDAHEPPPPATAMTGEPQPAGEATPARLPEPSLERRRSAWGAGAGLLLCLVLAILVVPSDGFLSFGGPAQRNTASLPPASSAARPRRVNLSPLHHHASPSRAGNASPAPTISRDAGDTPETLSRASAAAGLAAVQHPAEERYAPPASRAGTQMSTRVASRRVAPIAPVRGAQPAPAQAASIQPAPALPARATSSAAVAKTAPQSQPTSTAAKPAAPTLSAAELGALVARGDAFVAMRDIVSARLFYLRAAEAGDGRAAMRMAVTFDPEFLDRVDMGGAFGNRQKALAWYRRARDLGDAKAGRQLQKFGMR